MMQTMRLGAVLSLDQFNNKTFDAYGLQQFPKLWGLTGDNY